MDSDKQSPAVGNLNRSGRPKGSQNKFTAHAKEAMQMAFDRLGGVDRMVEWAASDEKNLGDFYKLYARLIPLEVTGRDGKDLIPATPTDVARDALFMLELAQREKPSQHSTVQH